MNNDNDLEANENNQNLAVDSNSNVFISSDDYDGPLDDEDDIPSEHSPLLSSSPFKPPNENEKLKGKSYKSLIFIPVLLTLFISFFGFIFWVFNFDTNNLSSRQSAIPFSQLSLKNSVVFDSPSDFKLNHDDIIDTHIPFGIDFDQAVGVDGLGHSDIIDPNGNFIKRFRLSVARKVANFISPLKVSLQHPISISAQTSSQSVHLFNLTVLNILDAPLTTNLQNSHDHLNLSKQWLGDLNVIASINPNNDIDLGKFFEDVWVIDKGLLDIFIYVPQVKVHIWKGSILHTNFEMNNIQFNDTLKLPHLKPFPKPGTTIKESIKKLIDLVDLKNLSIYSYNDINNHSQIEVDASASIELPKLDLLNSLKSNLIPFEIPLIGRLPFSGSKNEGKGGVNLAHIKSKPVNLTNDQHLLFGGIATTSLSENDSENEDSIKHALSRFLSNFLNNESTPFEIIGDVPNNDYPDWLKDTIYNIHYNFSLPGVPPMPDIIQNVKMENIHVRRQTGFPWPNPFPGQPGGPGQVLVTGILTADIVLPSFLRSIPINVEEILPDLVLFNGSPPTINSTSYPSNAFATFHPNKSFECFTQFVDDPNDKYAPKITRLYAQVIDAPIKIIQGRDSVFRSFMSKMLFGKALVGVDGIAHAKGGLKDVKYLESVNIHDLKVNGEFKATN